MNDSIEVRVATKNDVIVDLMHVIEKDETDENGQHYPRIGYNGIVHLYQAPGKNLSIIMKITLNDFIEFKRELSAMLKLKGRRIAPELIDWSWCNGQFTLDELASHEAFKRNKEIRRGLDLKQKYDGVGILKMVKIDNVLPRSEYRRYTRLIISKFIEAFRLGVTTPEPDVVVFRLPTGNFDARILDWGGAVEGDVSELRLTFMYLIDEYDLDANIVLEGLESLAGY